MALASVPIGLAGYFLEAWVEAAFTSLRVVGFSLLFTGTLLWSTRRLLPERSWQALGWRGALWIGAWQVLALLPGVSRSGTTIAAGMHVGLERRAAADFGFLLAIPALVGATLFKASDASEAAWAEPSLWVGLVVSGVVGYVTLTTLVGFVARRGLHPFAPYCWVVGVGVVGYAFQTSSIGLHLPIGGLRANHNCFRTLRGSQGRDSATNCGELQSTARRGDGPAVERSG